ncbi:hypothetical protein HYALB_00008008 [Hymenoscyphus albidus]|uniref:2EXR domain-containing protein n=1 Tax=Hymenoscyphus albidus TaxID=595503 RepID=A0A9N9LAI7_9HELO|nr:hypothetical protein HYALB_00008008 [Hymenoscyphus albidus]
MKTCSLHKFGELSPELRCLIWELAIDIRPVYTYIHRNYHASRWTPGAAPDMFPDLIAQANREAREIALMAKKGYAYMWRIDTGMLLHYDEERVGGFKEKRVDKRMAYQKRVGCQPFEPLPYKLLFQL